MATTTTRAASAERDDRMPPGIPFIVSNEFAERFCFYGINSILTVYLTQHMHFTESRAASWQSLFKSGAYFFPMLGAIVSDVFWGKFRTIMTFSLVYAVGCFLLAVMGHQQLALALSLGLVALGTGGIKPCVSTNVGDQFTAKNQHLIERAFSWFYMAINAGSSISIWFCPELLEVKTMRDALHVDWSSAQAIKDVLRVFVLALPPLLMMLAISFAPGSRPLKLGAAVGVMVVSTVLFFLLLRSDNVGPILAFGLPAAMMLAATTAFFAGRRKFAIVPPAGRAWLKEVFSPSGVKLILSLLVIYFFVACFWMLWDQSNGNTFTLQAQSSLMDKNLGFGFTVLPAQLQVVNGLLILGLAPVFSYVIYPLMGRFFKVTPLRKIGIGLFTIAGSFVIVARIEQHIQSGQSVSAWWQILAYVVLTAAEILVSITALEFSYKQAPLRIKSFIMALFLLSTAVGNLGIAAVNNAMVKPLTPTAIESGAQTWVTVDERSEIIAGQKIDIGEDGDHGKTGITARSEGKDEPLEGTFVVGEIDTAGRLRLTDVVHRADIASKGTFTKRGKVSTYYLVGPNYFYFFVAVMLFVATVFIFVAMRYKEQTHVRDEKNDEPQPDPAGSAA